MIFFKDLLIQYPSTMKRISYCFASMFFFLLMCVEVNAQENLSAQKDKSSENSASMQQPVDRLQLRKDQQVPYREIIKRYAILVRDVRKSALSREEKFKKIDRLESEREAEIKEVLSPEQFKVYLEMKQEQKAKYIDMRKK